MDDKDTTEFLKDARSAICRAIASFKCAAALATDPRDASTFGAVADTLRMSHDALARLCPTYDNVR